HAGILRAVLAMDEAAGRDEPEVYALLRAKDVSDLRSITASYQTVTRDALLALPGLYGDAEVLDAARCALPAVPAIERALDELQRLVRLAGKADVTIDLADLRGYQYESGAMFSLYVPGLP